MATKFSQIYKQELKSKGVLSSLGSAALKQRKERMDIRNVLFGGSGVVSATGQKIFGKGFSALSGAPKLSSDSPQQSAAINALTISSEKQEVLLKIVAKNTMNMNSMARDMNITRQNIASMTKKVTGKSSRGADALWMGAEKRNTLLADKKKTPTNVNKSTEGSGGGILSSIGSGIGGIFSGIGSVLSGGAGMIGSIVSGLLGVVGKVGGGILGVLGSVLSGIPGGFILAAIALAGVAYLIKQVSENVDFSKLKNDILVGLGFDPNNKEKTLTQQLLEKMGFDEKTAKNFDENIKSLFTSSNNVIVRYTKAAFTVLSDVFLNFGKMFAFYTEDLFQFLAAKLSGGLIRDRSFQGVAADLETRKMEEAGAQQQFDLLDKLYDGGTGKGNVGFGEGVTGEGRYAETPKTLANLREVARRKLEDIVTSRRGLEEEFKAKESALLGIKKVQQSIPERFNQELTSLDVQQYAPTKLTGNPRDMANLIIKRFREAGFSNVQALGAVANAITESSLNPNAVNVKGNDDSHGLFQLNRKRSGLGTGYTPEQLYDPEKNIQIAIEAAKNSKNFKSATTVEDATKAFLKDVEKPEKKDDPAELQRRLQKMEKFSGSSISALTTELNDGVRTLSFSGAPSKAPTVINNNNTTNTSSGGNAVASSWNRDAAELFMSQSVSQL